MVFCGSKCLTFYFIFFSIFCSLLADYFLINTTHKVTFFSPIGKHPVSKSEYTYFLTLVMALKNWSENNFRIYFFIVRSFLQFLKFIVLSGLLLSQIQCKGFEMYIFSVKFTVFKYETRFLFNLYLKYNL